MLALVAQQALVVLVAWQDVDHAPEAGPAVEFAGPHVGGDQAGGGADGHDHTSGISILNRRRVVFVNVVSVRAAPVSPNNAAVTAPALLSFPYAMPAVTFS